MKKTIIYISVVALTMTFALTQSVIALDVDYIGAIETNLHAPTSLSVSVDRIAVLEPYANQIKIFTPDGIISQKMDLTGDIHSLVSYIDNNYLFCNRDDNSIISISFETGLEVRLFDQSEIISQPTDLIYQESNLYILDSGRRSILIYDNQLILTGEIPLLDINGALMTSVTSFDRDPATGHFYLLNQLDSRIIVLDEAGSIISSMSSFGGGEGQLTRGGEIAITPAGYILVTDRYQGQIVIFDPDGQFVGNIGASTGHPLDIPTGIDVDENGLIYVSSTMNSAIKIFYANLQAQDDQAVMTALPYYPDDGADLSSTEIILKAFVEAADAARQVAGIEFQLFASDNQNVPLLVSGLKPDSTIMENGPIQKVMAVWSPEIDFASNTEFLWNSRVMVDGEYGEWSQLRSFKVSSLPSVYSLNQNFPNPFNPTTKIAFSLPAESDLILEVINILGERIRVILSDRLPAGNHAVDWDGRDENGRQAGSGIYFYRLRTEQFEKTRKMVLLK